MLHGTNSKISDVSPCTDLTDLDIFHVTARSVRLAVAFVSYSEITESSELKEADLLDATACLYKLGTPGGALGYFLGGYVPPGTPNWHPVLEKISPKIDTPF